MRNRKIKKIVVPLELFDKESGLKFHMYPNFDEGGLTISYNSGEYYLNKRDILEELIRINKYKP